VAGDLRIVMATFNGTPAAVLLKPVAAGAPVSDKHNFTSDAGFILSDHTGTVNTARVY
jgi:hypothetical protein